MFLLHRKSFINYAVETLLVLVFRFDMGLILAVLVLASALEIYKLCCFTTFLRDAFLNLFNLLHKGTAVVILSDLPFNKVHAQFTTVPLKGVKKIRQFLHYFCSMNLISFDIFLLLTLMPSGIHI